MIGPAAAHCERLVISSVAEKSLNHFGHQELGRYRLLSGSESIVCAATAAIPSLSGIVLSRQRFFATRQRR